MYEILYLVLKKCKIKKNTFCLFFKQGFIFKKWVGWAKFKNSGFSQPCYSMMLAHEWSLVTWCWHTLSGHIGKVVASNAEVCKVARSNPGCGWAAPIYTMHEALRGHCPCRWGVGGNQSIGSTVSDTIVCNWLWLTATRSSPLGYFRRFLQVVDNWPHILW